jgi:zinc/manganese transport system permease protein
MSPDASTFAWWLLPLLMALLTGAMAGVVGPLLVLRRRVLHSNLIAHAVLPGVALALAAGIDPLLGGLASGLTVTWLAEWLSSRRLLDDLGQEVVANTLLAASLGLGVLLIQALDGDVDLNSLLFGDLLTAGPVELLRAGIALVMLLILVCSRYQHLVFLTMDPEGAAAAGLPVRLLQQLLSLATSLVIVSGMAAVGLVISLALYCAPALIGIRTSTSLAGAMTRSAIIGMTVAVGGFGLGVVLDSPPGPVIAGLCVPLLLGLPASPCRGKR